MEIEKIEIRTATEADAGALLAIYAPYVEQTAITFEYEAPTVSEFQARIRHTLEKYPYLVAEKRGRILGYAYVSPFKERAAYDWAVETSIYVDKAVKHSGIGGKLHAALEQVLKKMGILNMEACIGIPEKDDEYLDHNSMNFHAHLGYRLVGTFKKCGYKYDRWYDMIWMEKLIGNHTENQPYPKRYTPDILRTVLGKSED